MSRIKQALPLFFIVLAGCGDGTLEIKSKTNPSTVIIEKPAPTVIVEKRSPPVVIVDKSAPTRETTRTQTTNINGTTIQTKDTRTTTP